MSQPVFMAHQGRQSPDVLRDFLEQRQRAGAPPPIGTVFLPRYKPLTSKEILNGFGAFCDVLLADPETHKLDWDFPDRGRGRRELDYLQESDPVANRKRFLENVLVAQVEAGATTIVSPWLTHGESLSTRNFRASLRFAEETLAHPLVAGYPVNLGFAATQAVVADEDARNDFIDAIVELGTADIYFRLRVSGSASYSQYQDLGTLLGLKALVSALSRNGRGTHLPLVGMAGWLMLPFGARSYGAGISASTQRFVSPSPGFGTQPLDWYFLPALLGFVRREELAAIYRTSGTEPCACPFCVRQGASTSSWDRNLAGLHYLWWCAELADEAATAESPVAAVRQRLDEAMTFWSQLMQAQIQLDKRSQPSHLAAWSQVVA